MEKFIKENLLFLILPALILIFGVYNIITTGYQAVTNYSEANQKNAEAKIKEEKLAKIKQEKLLKAENKNKSQPKNGKVIYEVLGQQFTPEASFGIMFENVLANITNSGVRIRMIQYNYSPLDDKIIMTNTPGYNACELFFTAVGSYAQLQNFFKNITKENYLSSIQEVYIEPYDKDKNILIAKFKIRLYTKTI